MSVLAGLAVIALLVVGGWVWHLNGQLGEIPRFETDLERPGRPSQVGEGTTLLLVGVDNEDAAGTLDAMISQPGWKSGVFRSDTIMVLHFDADHRRAQLVSIPRDTWVSVPGHGQQKINAAFSYGGPGLLAETVENYTGTRLDHAMMVDMAGFASITDTLGGVQVQVPESVANPDRSKTWSAGTHTLQANEALQYVRHRKGLPGGDFDRMQRQQNFLRGVLRKTVSNGTLTNPVHLTQMVGDVSEFLAVDAGLSNSRLRNLVLDSRDLRVKDVEFATIPNRGTDRAQGQSIVRGDQKQTREMFDWIERDQFQAWLGDHEVDQLPAPGNVD